MTGARLLAAAAALTAVLALTGCGGGSGTAHRESGVLGAGQPESAWATPVELGWLRRLGAWNGRLTEGLRRAALIESDPASSRLLLAHNGATIRAHEAALAPAVRCSSDLRAQAGPPPTARLDHAYGVFLAACRHLERVQALATRAIESRASAAVAEARREADTGAGLLLQANELIPPGETQALPVVGGPSEQSRIEPRLSRVAADPAGKSVEVRCWSAADWRRLLVEERTLSPSRLGGDTLGFTTVAGSRENLHPDVCANLADLSYRHAEPQAPADVLSMAASVVTLAHESQHARGVVDEPTAECYGMQLVRRTAAELGVSAAYAARLAAAYWKHYPHELPSYRSPECRDGGALDLDPSSTTWP